MKEQTLQGNSTKKLQTAGEILAGMDLPFLRGSSQQATPNHTASTRSNHAMCELAGVAYQAFGFDEDERPQIREFSKPGWYRTSNRFVDIKLRQVGPMAASVYHVLARFERMNPSTGIAAVTGISVTRIVSLTGLGRTTVFKMLAVLVQHKLIVRKHIDGERNAYFLLEMEK